MTKKRVLKIVEIKPFAKRLTKIRKDILIMEKDFPLPFRISMPPVPAILGESIIYHLIEKEKFWQEKRVLKDVCTKHDSIELGGVDREQQEMFEKGLIKRRKGSDLLVKMDDNSECKIEVKSTSNTREKKGFQGFTDKDVTSDYLIWIHYGDFFIGSINCMIEICILENPNQYPNIPVQPKRIIYDSFKNMNGVKDNLIITEFAPNEIWLL